MHFEKRSPQETIRAHCPVCSAILGTKTSAEIKQFECGRCKNENAKYYQFYFYPGEKKPKAIHSSKAQGCNCGRCDR